MGELPLVDTREAEFRHDALMMRDFIYSDHYPAWQKLIQQMLDDTLARLLNPALASDQYKYWQGRYLGLQDVLAMPGGLIEEASRIQNAG